MAGEIITGGAVVATIGVKLLNDVCGPTAKYLGKEMASYAEIGVINLKKVFENAAKKIREQNKADGQVPARVLKEVLAEGYFCEDELTARYLGGVLASSKGPVARDDRAVAYCSLIRSLSTYQLRTHCILYTALLWTAPENMEFNTPFPEISQSLSRNGLTVVYPDDDYIAAMEFSENEDAEEIIQHAFVGLEKNGLLGGGFRTSTLDQNNRKGPRIRWFYPTILGVELFLWGQGFGDRKLDDYNPDLLRSLETPFSIVPLTVRWGHVNY